MLTLKMSAGSEQPHPSSNPDIACAQCHREIYERYQHTPMARASGPASEGMIPADFLHQLSGIQYRISERDGHVYLSYARPSSSPVKSLRGEEELLYYLGSGKRGRTFLFQREHYWFEIPINWYAKKGIWDMAPNYQRAQEMPMTLPVDSSCLHCHASEVQPALPDARNHYSAEPFLAGGITCARCHGDATQHLALAGRGPILNPDKLPVNERDSICLQCHLEAEVSVNRVGRTLYDFRPGDEVSDSVIRFVHRNAVGPGGRATSQWEALLQSACRRASGDRLTCTTCHDPHASPSPQEAVAYYRGKCLACHSEAKFADAHYPAQPDCASCHMPRSNTQDIAHEQVTDHRIQLPRGPALQSLEPRTAPSGELVAVRGTATDRDLGIAYSQLALHGDRQAATEARRLLRQAESEAAEKSRTPPDPDLHTQLGFLDQLAGDTASARREYELALEADPYAATAAGNLALINAQAGDLRAAVKLWTAVFNHDPAQSAAAMNLAATECRLGDAAAAKAVLERVVVFSPDNRRAREFAQALADGSQRCEAQR